MPPSAFIRDSVVSINEIKGALNKSHLSAYGTSTTQQITVDGIRLMPYDPRNGEIDRDLLLLPDVYIDNLSDDIDVYVKMILDSIWNACGYTHCRAYNEDGSYSG